MDVCYSPTFGWLALERKRVKERLMHVLYKSWKTCCRPSSFLQLVPTHVCNRTHQIITHASFLIVLSDWNAPERLWHTPGVPSFINGCSKPSGRPLLHHKLSLGTLRWPNISPSVLVLPLAIPEHALHRIFSSSVLCASVDRSQPEHSDNTLTCHLATDTASRHWPN
jgi:hypothetical protein